MEQDPRKNQIDRIFLEDKNGNALTLAPGTIRSVRRFHGVDGTKSGIVIGHVVGNKSGDEPGSTDRLMIGLQDRVDWTEENDAALKAHRW